MNPRDQETLLAAIGIASLNPDDAPVAARLREYLRRHIHAERARVPDALRHAAKVIELYDDALGGSCEMATSTDCAEVLTALADYYYADAPEVKGGE